MCVGSDQPGPRLQGAASIRPSRETSNWEGVPGGHLKPSGDSSTLGLLGPAVPRRTVFLSLHELGQSHRAFVPGHLAASGCRHWVLLHLFAGTSQSCWAQPWPCLSHIHVVPLLSYTGLLKPSGTDLNPSLGAGGTPKGSSA